MVPLNCFFSFETGYECVSYLYYNTQIHIDLSKHNYSYTAAFVKHCSCSKLLLYVTTDVEECLQVQKWVPASAGRTCSCRINYLIDVNGAEGSFCTCRRKCLQMQQEMPTGAEGCTSVPVSAICQLRTSAGQFCRS